MTQCCSPTSDRFFTEFYQTFDDLQNFDSQNAKQLAAHMCAVLAKKITDPDELVAIAKTCIVLERILKEQDKGFDVKSLQEFTIESLEQASALKQVSPLLFACHLQLFDQALCIFEKKPILSPEDMVLAPILLEKAAAQHKHEQVFLLIEQGADCVHVIDKTFHLFKALQDKNVAAAVVLINSGVDLDTKLTRGETFLHVAVRLGLVDVVSCLLSKNICINAQNAQGETALHTASRQLHTEITYMLLQHKADVSLLCHQNKTALLAPLAEYEETFDALVDFYQILFADYPLIQERLRVAKLTAFQPFLLNNAQKLVEQVGAEKSLQLACLLQDETLAHTIAQKLTPSAFSQALEYLKEIFSSASLDIVFFSPFSINPDHYKKGFQDLDVTLPSHDIDLKVFLEHFDALTFLDTKSPNYFDRSSAESDIGGYTPRQIRQSLDEMLTKITTKSTLLVGVPESGFLYTDFYQKIEWALKNVLVKLEELSKCSPKVFYKTRIAVMKTLFRTMNHCAGRYFNQAVKLYQKVCKHAVLDFPNEVYQVLRNYRQIAFQATIQQESHSTNHYNRIVKTFGQEYNLPGYKVLNTYYDPYGNEFCPKKVLDTYRKIYTPINIVRECIMMHLQEGAFRKKYIDWCKKTMPKNYKQERFGPIERTVLFMKSQKKSRQEIVQYLKERCVVVGENESFDEAILHEKESSYLEAEIFDMQTNEIRQDSLICRLIDLGVLRSPYYFPAHDGWFSFIRSFFGL